MKVVDLPFYTKLAIVKESTTNNATGTQTKTAAKTETTDKDLSAVNFNQINTGTKTVTKKSGEDTDKDPYSYLDFAYN